MGYLPGLHVLIVFVFIVLVVVLILVVVIVFVGIVVEVVVVEEEVIHKWRQIETVHAAGSPGLIFSRFGGGYVDQK